MKSSPQNWCAWGLIISVLTGQEMLKFDWWVVIDMDYRIAKEFLIFFYDLVKLFTVQNWLELGLQLLLGFLWKIIDAENLLSIWVKLLYSNKFATWYHHSTPNTTGKTYMNILRIKKAVQACGWVICGGYFIRVLIFAIIVINTDISYSIRQYYSKIPKFWSQKK